MPGPGEDALRRVRVAIEREMNLIVEDLLGRAQRDAPVLTGRLRASGDAQVHDRGEKIVGEVSFSTPYAAYQHEHTELKHPQGGRSKYLEANLIAMVPDYRERLAAAAKRAIESG